RSASPRSILRRNCCLLVNCILAGAAGVAGAVAAAAGTGGNDCAWTVETNRSNAVGTRQPTRRWVFCPPARLPLLLSPFCLMLFAIMIPLPLVWKPSLAPPVGPGPRRSRLCGTEATAWQAAAVVAPTHPEPAPPTCTTLAQGGAARRICS